MIDRFLDLASPGTSLVCVASMAGHKQRVNPALESELATTPTSQLLGITHFDLSAADPSFAYHVAKRGVHLRVAAASQVWGVKGPGSTVASLAVQRVGTPEDIAGAIEFLCSPAASFIEAFVRRGISL